MNNFIYDIPTKVYFGQGQIVHLPELIQTCGTRVLLVYGGGSVKKTGLYDTITNLLKENGIAWQELSGVQANPKIGSVREGVRLVREHQLDCVLAVGGGSTLDCSKAICAGAAYEGDPWELVLDRTKVKECLPLITVLTMAATGSEMDNIAVIQSGNPRQARFQQLWHVSALQYSRSDLYLYRSPGSDRGGDGGHHVAHYGILF